MRIFVAGGTGVIGRSAVPVLVEQGHEVTAVARTADKAELVRAWGAAPVEVDLFDADAVKAAVAGHDVVVNLATSIPPLSKMARPKAWATNDRLRREASRHLVDAALAAGAGRYVQESVAFIYADGGPAWITEESPVAPIAVTASALDAEAQARRFAAAGATAVVLRFGSFYGPDNAQTEAILRMARMGFAAVPGARHAYVSPIRTEDAGAAVVVAATEAPAGIYNVADDEPLTREAFEAAIAAAVGRTRLRPVPKLAARLLADKVPITRSHRVSNRALRDATGWKPRYPTVGDGLAGLTSKGPAVDVGVALDEAEPPVQAVRRLP